MTSIEAVVFDAYGTLFDVHSAARRHAGGLGGRAEAVSALWRERQLQYTWTRALMGRHRDFAEVTRAALRYALAAHGIEDAGIEAGLLDAYGALDAYPEVPAALDGLKGRGFRLAILSNATPSMLAAGARAAGIADRFDAVLSIEEAGVYKPDPAVYALVGKALGVAADATAFVSSNRWDVAGAVAFGFQVAWVNRGGAPDEYPDLPPRWTVGDLAGLAGCFGG
ncbi:MAG: haloacid dehalogenase type II [Geminicoccaceae bacterium]|nr:haloacid dehalogenase type II [Geminicoccaceae bacterium]